MEDRANGGCAELFFSLESFFLVYSQLFLAAISAHYSLCCLLWTWRVPLLPPSSAVLCCKIIPVAALSLSFADKTAPICSLSPLWWCFLLLRALSLLSPGHSSLSPFMCGVANRAAALSELRRVQGLLRGAYRSYLTVCKGRAKSSWGKRYAECFSGSHWKTLHTGGGHEAGNSSWGTPSTLLLQAVHLTLFAYFLVFALKLIKIFTSITQWYSRAALAPLHHCDPSDSVSSPHPSLQLCRCSQLPALLCASGSHVPNTLL